MIYLAMALLFWQVDLVYSNSQSDQLDEEILIVARNYKNKFIILITLSSFSF